MLDDIVLSLPKILSNFDKTWITNNPPKNLTALEAQSKVSSDVSSSSTPDPTLRRSEHWSKLAEVIREASEFY